MNKFYFTVIIPTLNEELNIPNLLKDLSQQTYKEFKVIIVDGKSEDNTVKIARKYDNVNMSVETILCTKRGVSHQRNLGAKKAVTDWIVFMDADNRIPKYYMLGLKFNSEMVNTDFISTWIEPDTNSSIDRATANMINMTIDFSKNTPNPYILESMILAKRISFNKLNGFDEKIHWHEGGDLLRRAKKKGMKFEFIRNPKYTYSFRRLRKTGKFSILQKVIKMELSRLILNEPTNEQKVLYPMDGGTFYQIDKNEGNKLNLLLSEIFNKKNEQKNTGFISKILERLFKSRR